MRHLERLGQIARHAEIQRFDRGRFGGVARNNDHRQVGLQPLRFAHHGESIHPRHLQIDDQQIVGIQTQPLERRSSVRRRVDVVIGERKRLRQQIADAGFVIHDENSRTHRGGAHRRHRGGGGAGSRPPAARTLTIEPRVDIALAEAPLAAHAHRWNLSGLDQPVDRAQIDLKIGENFFSC